MTSPKDNETICARSTPNGVGALAVIRTSGPEAIPIVDGIFSGDLENGASHTAFFGFIKDGEQVIDEVVVTLFRGPRSFTGEDVVEISCHGSPYIQQKVLRLLLDNGCRMAEQGEFTMKAFFNGKMDLSQAEAVADLISSTSGSSHKLAMHQMRGGFSKEIQGLRQELIDLASLVELELDFSEEDVEFADKSKLQETVANVRNTLQDLVDSFAMGNVIKNGVPVAIVGVPNVGKSTLLNVLMNEERAIVSDIAGTTRDSIEDEVVLDGVSFRFIDTAGIRETSDEVEAIGVERTYQNIRKAAIVIYMVDATDLSKDRIHQFTETFRNEVGNEHKKLVVVANKIDQAKDKDMVEQELADIDDHVSISAVNGENIEGLKEHLLSYVRNEGVGEEDIMVTNERHYNALARADEALGRVEEGMEAGITGDLIALDLRDALHHLGAITGEVTTDDLLGNIFANFCIGK